MINLTDAITHCNEKAKELREQPLKERMDIEDIADCEECAEDHEQLAAWLEQLQAIKLLYKEYEGSGGGFHYQVGRVFDGDYVLDNNGSEDK